MTRLLLGVVALCLLAGCDSNEPSIALDGTWTQRIPVSFFVIGGSGPNTEGTREDTYTFTTRGNQITGSLVTTDRDLQQAVRSQSTVPVTGEILSDTQFTIIVGDPQFTVAYAGTATGAELRLVKQEDANRPTAVVTVLRRP